GNSLRTNVRNIYLFYPLYSLKCTNFADLPSSMAPRTATAKALPHVVNAFLPELVLVQLLFFISLHRLRRDERFATLVDWVLFLYRFLPSILLLFQFLDLLRDKILDGPWLMYIRGFHPIYSLKMKNIFHI
ncbi:hypothetical protein PMAYCL1PPCAC_10306, partial [Pristionchus mayeri]